MMCLSGLVAERGEDTHGQRPPHGDPRDPHGGAVFATRGGGPPRWGRRRGEIVPEPSAGDRRCRPMPPRRMSSSSCARAHVSSSALGTPGSANGRGHTREGPEQHHMLRSHKRATPTQCAAPPQPCNSTTCNTTTGNATPARQHLATPRHMPCLLYTSDAADEG